MRISFIFMQERAIKAMHFPNDVYIGHNAIDSMRIVGVDLK